MTENKKGGAKGKSTLKKTQKGKPVVIRNKAAELRLLERANFPAGNQHSRRASRRDKGGRAPRPGRQPTSAAAQPSAPAGRRASAKVTATSHTERSLSAPTRVPLAEASWPAYAQSRSRRRQQRPSSRPLRSVRDRRRQRRPRPKPAGFDQSALPGGEAGAVKPRPCASACFKYSDALLAANSCGFCGKTIMQSAMFLAVQHDCVPMDKNAGCGPKSEEKREKMKRTLLKDWKTRLSYFLHNSSTPGKPKTSKKSKQQTFIKPSPEEALLWSEAFDELLASKYGLAAFRAFLKSEFCEENIEFWLACEDFKKTKSPQKLSSKARKIYTDFIEKEAPKEINIDFQTKTLIAQNIQEATSGCFTTAQKRVYSLMENNSYPRFLESEFYQDLCKKSQITTDPHTT